jgi:transposase-like protein
MKTSELNAPELQSEIAAINYVEARLWPNGPVCPKCGVIGQAGRLQGKSNRPGLWKCYACRKPFTVRMGTIFESSHVPLHIWLQVIYLMNSSKKGFSTRQIQRTLGGSMKTAWFLGHRVRECMKELGIEPMGGEGQFIEADETFVGRKASSRAYEPPAKKQAILALVQRGGGVRSFHVPNVTAANIRPIIAKHVHTDSSFQTDESNVYGAYWNNFADRGVVNHSQKEYVLGTDYTNTVEGYFSILKRGIYGIYQHVSEAHLHRYLAEFDFRYSHRVRLGINDTQRADLALLGAKGKRLTYETTGKHRPTDSVPF